MITDEQRSHEFEKLNKNTLDFPEEEKKMLQRALDAYIDYYNWHYKNSFIILFSAKKYTEAYKKFYKCIRDMIRYRITVYNEYSFDVHAEIFNKMGLLIITKYGPILWNRNIIVKEVKKLISQNELTGYVIENNSCVKKIS